MKKEGNYRVFSFLSAIAAFALMVINAYLHQDQVDTFTAATGLFLLLSIVFLILAAKYGKKYRNQ